MAMWSSKDHSCHWYIKHTVCTDIPAKTCLKYNMKTQLRPKHVALSDVIAYTILSADQLFEKDTQMHYTIRELLLYKVCI